VPAYVIAQLQVHDTAKYREYALKVADTAAPFNAKMLVAADTADVREGQQPYPRIVIGEFADAATARAWYESEAYQAIAPLRQAASTGTVFIVEGFSLPS
jgi:uncharacterized protein (DUF1330 family)